MKELIERLRHGYPSKERLEAADAIEKLEAENERLTGCLRRANSNHEEFERKWYLATDENAQLKAELAAMREQRPVAYWIPKAEQFCFASPTGRPFAKAWEPLYAAPGAKP